MTMLRFQRWRCVWVFVCVFVCVCVSVCVCVCLLLSVVCIDVDMCACVCVCVCESVCVCLCECVCVCSCVCVCVLIMQTEPCCHASSNVGDPFLLTSDIARCVCSVRFCALMSPGQILAHTKIHGLCFYFSFHKCCPDCMIWRVRSNDKLKSFEQSYS